MREPSRRASAKTSVADPAAPPSSSPPPPLPPRVVIWLLRIWWGLAAFVGAAIVSDLLLLPLALTPSHWWQGVQSQFGVLLDLGQTYPLQAAAIAALLLVVTGAGYAANRRERAAERKANLLQAATVTSDQVARDLAPRFDALDAGQTALQQGQGQLADQLAGGQAVGLAVGAMTLATARETLTDVRQIQDALQSGISQLAQQTARRTGVTRRVFLSCTALDLRAHRERLNDTLARMNQFAVDMSQFGAGGGDATVVSKREVASADYFVLIVAWRYGSIPAGETHSVTHLEYLEARRLGLPIFVYLADPATEQDDGPDALFPAATRNLEHAAQLRAFRKSLMDSDKHVYDTFTTPDNLAARAAAALGRAILNDVPAIASASGRMVALADMPRHGAFVGRAEQLQTLMARLSAGDDVGIYALEGMGGVGKTALAAEAAERFALSAELVSAFPGGVAWVSCVDLTGEAGLNALVDKLAVLLGMGFSPQQTPQQRRDALAAELAARPRTLLALDNIEPGFPTETALQTLAVRDHTTLLLTSREQVAPALVFKMEVAPLPAPDAADLFAARLGQASGGARPMPEEHAEIASLVKAVDGLPLAIELVATYAGNQRRALVALRDELAAEGIDAAAYRSDPKRALGATFDRSWRVLSPSQQRLFAGLSLLDAASFPREAAEALSLAAASDAPPREPRADPGTSDSGDDVAALIAGALVEPLEGGRLRLHPLLREYAARRLSQLSAASSGAQSTPEDQMGDALLAYWLAYAEGRPDYEGMNALEAEASGLMGALSWAHGHQRYRELLALSYALNRYWFVRGRVGEARIARPWALEAAKKLDDRPGLRWALHELAVLDARTGEPQRARAGYAEALALARELGDKSAIRTELHALAVLDAETGEPQRARAGFAEALALARELGDKRAIWLELHGLAVLDANEGNGQRARAGYAEALALARELGDKSAIQAELHELAVLDAQTGEPQRARAGYTEALALARELGDKRAIQAELHGLAVLDARTGEPQRARAGYAEALALARELGDKSAIRLELHELAVLDAETGEPQRARAGFAEALALARELGDKRAIWLELHGLAVLDANEGNGQRARAGYAEALALARELGDKRAIRLELHELAVLDANEGNGQRARAGYAEALALARELGDVAAQSSELQSLGVRDLRQRRRDLARSELEESLRLARRVEQPALVAEAAWWLAELEREEGRTEAACAGFREALAIYERLGNPDAEITRQRLQELGCEP